VVTNSSNIVIIQEVAGDKSMKYLILLLSFTLVACTDPVEKCVEKKQKNWRENNPKADYGKAASANEKFRNECLVGTKKQ